jgi:hypothetical protein
MGLRLARRTARITGAALMPTSLPPPAPLPLLLRILMPFWFWRTTLLRIRIAWICWRAERHVARWERRDDP